MCRGQEVESEQRTALYAPKPLFVAGDDVVAGGSGGGGGGGGCIHNATVTIATASDCLQ